MSTATLDASPPVARSTRQLTIFLSITAFAAVGFIAFAAAPYFLSSSYGPVEYAPRRGWLLLHIAGGMLALLTGPVQLWLGLTDRRLDIHRRMGLAYFMGVGVGSVAAVYLAVHTDFGWLFGAGLLGLAITWIVTTGMAFLAIKRLLIEQHKEWMIRSYVVTFAFVTFRVIFPALQASGIGTIPEQLAAAAWGCWAVPLVVTEAVLQGRKILSVKALP